MAGLLTLLHGCSALEGYAEAVPTFESMGITWSPAAGAPDRICDAQYRERGQAAWQAGLPLWFDARDREYRGSLVHLQPGTDYEIELRLSGTEQRTRIQARTWDEAFPIGDTVYVRSSRETLYITESGRPDAYRLCLPWPGDSAVIDADSLEEYCVVIDASYIIVRGLTLRGACHSAILLGKQHDVVIEQCDMSNWGHEERGFPGVGANFNSGIFAEGNGEYPARIVIQDNRIHHPRHGSTHWEQQGPQGNHPHGPQGITILNGGGHYVIRYNAFYSSPGRYFNDAMGEWRNFTFGGFPGRDTDIHHNWISHCWDNGIEAEGGNRNVRIWANFTDRCYRHIATANTNLGPVYIWRNVSGVAERSPGNRRAFWGKTVAVNRPDPEGMAPRGMIYLFHNTITQPVLGGRLAGAAGIGNGQTVMSRNNLYWCSLSQGPVIFRDAQSPANRFDYDLYNGEIEGPPGSEAHGIRMERPQFAADNLPYMPELLQSGTYWLAPGAPGQDAGEALPGFSGPFTGAAPDIGAYETGLPGPQFGPRGRKIRAP
ncbi:MAG: right-handed parallel beta-helix repeat-containing protein [Bacteroidia bacterium]|nr:right-handed parallel beta-helix repeat-containing protein [Bacteroidia bacterium]